MQQNKSKLFTAITKNLDELENNCRTEDMGKTTEMIYKVINVMVDCIILLFNLVRSRFIQGSFS